MPSDRWATFDCYGTLIDWLGGIRSTLASLWPAADAEALGWVMSGGEDHSLVAAFPAGTRLPPGWKVIGAVAGGHGVLVDGQSWAESPGWGHFSAR